MSKSLRVENGGWNECLHRVVRDHDFIHPDGWFDLDGESFLVAKRDFAFQSGLWRDTDVESLVAHLRRAPMKSVLVTHSDIHTSGRHSFALRVLGARHVWGTNVDPLPGVATPVPLGLTSPEPGSEIHALLSDRAAIAEAFQDAERPHALTWDFYVNVKAANHPSRTEFLREVSSMPGVVVKEPLHTPEGRLAYLKSLREFPYVLAPRGNGVDTHRLWETLYLGGIPIVLRDKAIVRLVRGLPVMVLTRWSDLRNRRLLDEELDRIRREQWDATRLRMSSWISLLSKSHLRMVRRTRGRS